MSARLLPAEVGWSSLPALRVIALGGERLPAVLLRQWLPAGEPQQERRRISFGATSFSQPSDGSSSDSSEDELRHDPRSDSDGSDGDDGPPAHAPRSAYSAEADVGFYQSKSVAIHNNPTDDDDGVGEFDML